MTEHEKRIREALEAGEAEDLLFADARTKDLRALLADLDAVRGALEEAEEWVQEYVTQMSSYVISDSAAESLARIRAALKGATA